MRNLALILAAAAGSLAIAAPAAAQYYPAPQYPVYPTQAPGYGQPYGYNQAYGTQSPWLYNFRDNRYAGMMQQRVSALRNDIRNMGMQRILSRSETRTLDRQADRIQQKIWRYSQYGVGAYEAQSIDRQVNNLERRIMRAASDWNVRPGARRYNPYDYNRYQGYYGKSNKRDRDHDGKIHRYKDKGRDRD